MELVYWSVHPVEEKGIWWSGCYGGIVNLAHCKSYNRWFFIVYVDLVPENAPVALKMDIEGYECKVILVSKVADCLSAFICRDEGDIGLFIN